MAKKNAYYFSHDCNARRDEKILAVRMRHKVEGYGVYFMIVEMLAEEPTHMCLKDYNMIAFEIRVGADVVKSIVEDFGLFQFTEDGERFYSESLMERMSDLDDMIEKRREAGRKGGLAKSERSKSVASATKKRSNAKDLLPEIVANKIKEEERKEKEISSCDEKARAREEVGSAGMGSVEELSRELKEEIQNGGMTAESANRMYGIGASELLHYVDWFKDKLTIDGVAYKTRGDFRRHFGAWLRIQAQEKYNKQQKAQQNGRQQGVTDDYIQGLAAEVAANGGLAF